MEIKCLKIIFENVERLSMEDAYISTNLRIVKSTNWFSNFRCCSVFSTSGFSYLRYHKLPFNICPNGAYPHSRWKKGSQKDVPPPFTEESLLFAFGCWLSCGDPVRGRALCNVPLKNSPYFAKVYGCPPAAPMNPEHKCRIRI